MKITKRQKEFLQSLIDLYQLKDTPIHYSEVAQKMGVSKWTAYDMLQLLHKEGFLEVEYLIPESYNYKWGKLGRSTITLQTKSLLIFCTCVLLILILLI